MYVPLTCSVFVNGEPFHFAGFNNYYLPTFAADPHHLEERTTDVDVVFRDASELGLTVLRTWAFADGPQWNAIQPSLGVLDERVLSEVQWFHGRNILDFYKSPAIRKAYKDYVRAILMRQNSITGILYKDDPTIMAWDLANEPLGPGDDSGQILTAWVKEMSDFVKSIDPNHLTMVGTWGYYGRSSPDLLPENPYDLSWRTSNLSNDAGIWSADPICKGEDWAALMTDTSIDIGSVHVYPEFMPVCTDDCKVYLGNGTVSVQGTLTDIGYWTLCSTECRVKYIKRWLRVHFEQGQALGKPVIVGEFGSQRPMAMRNAIYEAGSLFWILEAPEHPDWDGYTVYNNGSNYPHDPEPWHFVLLPGESPSNQPQDTSTIALIGNQVAALLSV
ncbi:g10791 [Coccomyxa elongata]